MRVLLVDDDEPIVMSLKRGLVRYGYEVEWLATGAQALRAGPADVVLLDLGLPDLDGLDVCRSLRARSDVPIIVISARSELADRVAGLELGADDYISKPFGVREVIARIRAVMRRVNPEHGSDDAGHYGRVTVDRRAARVFLDGIEVPLTRKEYGLLAFLSQQPGALVTREQIMDAVWDANWFGSTKTLDVHVSVLRRKFAGALTISAVRGVGFRLVVDGAGS
ncbi:response regulator transcription factor [Promicromonospora sp. Populi]|uniref:response regulator transcription factor n=1 Tax=Promicromonospora sp. Populi TaxID=3239420 RepID=UPI0034E2F59A